MEGGRRRSVGNRPVHSTVVSSTPSEVVKAKDTFPGASKRCFHAAGDKRKLWPSLAALFTSIVGVALFGLLAYKHSLRTHTTPWLDEDHHSNTSASGSMKVYDVSQRDTREPTFFEEYFQMLADPRENKQEKDHSVEEGIPPPLAIQVPQISKHLGHKSFAVPQDWDLPRADGAEELPSSEEQLGKDFIAQLAKRHGESDLAPSPEAQHILNAVASQLTNGENNQLLGLTIGLGEIAPLEGPSIGNEPLRMLKVVKFLGEGTFKVVVEVLDESSNERFALSILYMPKKGEGDNPLVPFDQFSNAMAQENKNTQVACRGLSPAVAADQYGINVPLFTAHLVGVSTLLVTDEAYIWGKVQVLERLYGDLQDLKTESNSLPQQVKAYISRRLLLQVLHLQEAGISHNDIKWGNFFLRSDGSFLLGDFGSSCMLGERMNSLSGVSLCYAEPQLVVDFYQSMFDGQPPLPDHRSDMWSLGVVLFELFTEGHLPYGIKNYSSSLASMKARMTALMYKNVTPSTLLPVLEEASVPERWQELICKLLEPKREMRITAQKVATEFRDLFQGSRFSDNQA